MEKEIWESNGEKQAWLDEKLAFEESLKKKSKKKPKSAKDSKEETSSARR